MTATPAPPSHPAVTLGLAFLAQVAWEGREVQAVSDALVAKLGHDPHDAGALLDLSTLHQLTGARDKGLELQAVAVEMQRTYRCVHGAGGGLRILAFVVAGDLMANTPLDFLLEGSDAELTQVFIDGPPPAPSQLPEHDIAFLAIGQSNSNDRLLRQLRDAFGHWPRPVINGRPMVIASLTRDGVAAAFAGNPLVIAPKTLRLDRAALEAIANGAADLDNAVEFPMIARPVGSHAGDGLLKLDAPTDMLEYLQARDEAEFYISSFFDYSGPDGAFRKLRIVFVRGRPFISHMAVSARWMVHYLNADMDESPANRAEEAAMMATFDEGFAVRHRQAFEMLCAEISLDYFGIDCAETPDGRLLLFEADVAMIVHALDPAATYPYKKPAMQKLFDGFLSELFKQAHLRQPSRL
jgi:hypothetical protein